MQDRHLETLTLMQHMIDQALIDMYTKGSEIACVDAHGLLRNQGDFIAVRRIYQAHGWKVEYCADQRDGDYVKFSVDIARKA